MKNVMTNATYKTKSSEHKLTHTTNKREIAMMEATANEAANNTNDATEIETHPFAPVLPPNATVMMMGTFPPTSDKWAMQFHYPNFYNDMWRIYGGVFFDDVNYFRIGDEKRFDPKQIRDFLFERGIASCPTVKQAVRETGNASDKNLTVVTSVDRSRFYITASAKSRSAVYHRRQSDRGAIELIEGATYQVKVS